MTVVRNTARDGAGQPITGATVEITCTPIGYTSDSSLVATHRTTTASDGTWTADLTPNTSINPPGTWYKVVEKGRDFVAIHAIVVPISGTPLELSALVVPAPVTPGIGETPAGAQAKADAALAAAQTYSAAQDLLRVAKAGDTMTGTLASTIGADAAAMSSTNTTVGGNVNTPHVETASATAASLVIRSRVTGDAVGRFAATTAGALSWGGGAGGRDVTLYRESADVLKTDDHLVVGSGVGGVAAYAGLPKGITGRSEHAGLIVGSSYAGGDDDGVGTDTTGRINLYSYQRANVGSFGETIRHFLMRSDAKAMEAWYGPQSLYNGTTRDPSGSNWKPWCWTGAHFEANDHGSVHGHWEVEVPDSSGALQGRLEIPFVDQSKLSNTITSTTIGIDYTNIRTNLADFSVRAQNITTGDFAGQTTCLRVGGGNDKAKDIRLSASSDMQASGNRWILRANTDTESGGNAGTNFQLIRCADDGAALGTAIGFRRSDGNAFMGVGGATSARLYLVWGTSGHHGLSLAPSASPGSGAAVDAQMTAATDRSVQVTVAGDANRRWVLYADGKQEWGDGAAARDVNLYRSNVDILKTDDSLYVAARLGVSATPAAANLITASQAADAQVLASTNTLAGGNVNAPHLYLESATAASVATTSRVTGDTSSRFLQLVTGEMQWGPGNASRDTNLFRDAADRLRTNDSFRVDVNVMVATTSVGGGTGVIGIANAAVAPPNTPSGGGVVYVEAGALKFKGSSGTVTVLAPA